MRSHFFIYLIILILFWNEGFTKTLEKSDAFITYIFDRKIRVVSPTQDGKDLHLIVDNRTLNTIVGHLEVYDSKGKKSNLAYISVKKDHSKSIKLPRFDNRRIFFVPDAPAFQEVELLLGKKIYEIPPQEEVR